MTTLVALTGVGKVFANGYRALSGLDLTVAAGERLTLLGASGCGKSTVLRLIAGLEAASEGDVVRAPTLTGRDIGFVFQEPTLMPWADVFENVHLPLRLRRQSRAGAAPRVHEALARVGLAARATSLPHQLSGGMRMRVSIARALVLEPKLLLMDEPFAALDELTRFRLNDDLLRLVETLGTTLVFVTHSIYEAVYLSTRIAIMPSVPGPLHHVEALGGGPTRDAGYRGSAIYAARCAAIGDVMQTVAMPKDAG